jgi:unsaturated rhamnogalacturonyl hydrolase
MDRRDFVSRMGLASTGILLSGYGVPASDNIKVSRRHLGRFHSYPPISFPEGKRIPLGWKAIPVGATQQTILSFDRIRSGDFEKPVFLRLTAAIDFREYKEVTAYLPGSGIELGIFDMKYAHPFQPFEIPVDAKHSRKIQKEGIGLKLVKGSGEAWFFADDDAIDNNKGLQPHLLTGSSTDMEKAFWENLFSMNSFSPFGWMGGCVQDALYELHRQGNANATQTLKMHLEHYLDKDKGIRFENPHTVPLDGTFNSIEDFLPFVSIVALHPDHNSIDSALGFMMKGKKENGAIFGGHITTEGCYTLAYPMAAMAIRKNDTALAQLAMDQLLHRMMFLTDEHAVYQRADTNGNRSYRNWGRGVVWYLLGVIKTIRILEQAGLTHIKGKDEILASFRKCIEMAVRHQDEHGLWHGYIDRHETGVDTSTSAGIAAAIAWGCRQGAVDKKYLPHASKARTALYGYLSPDGFLRQVSQINRGGEELQQSSYRVITQFGMGLLAQLEATLKA